MKVSIITIVYNNQLCIADCIRSVQGQNYSNIEHIVIDGGSTDGTQQQIEPYKDKLAYYSSEKDGGLYDALNKGIVKATGDVVGVLHSDDVFYDSTTIQKIVDVFKQYDADLVYANGQYVTDCITKVRRVYEAKPLKDCYLKFGWIPLHTTIFVARKVYEQYGLYDTQYKIASDYEMSLRWFTNPQIRKCYLDAYVVRMRFGGISTTIMSQKTKSTEDLDIIRKYHLLGVVTLGFKIMRKIPQYIIPLFKKYSR